MITLDASVMVDLLLGRLRSAEARIFKDNEPLHAPELLDLEVANALRRLVQAGKVPLAAAEQALLDLLVFPVERHRHLRLLPRVWELRPNLTALDAAYLAVAEQVGGVLLTRDRALAGVRSPVAMIELI